MKPRHLVLGGVLAGTTLMTVFGDRSPAGGVVAAVDRAASTAMPASEAADDSAPSRRANGAATEPEIALLRDRAELLGGDSDAASPLFASHSWTPPPPPPPPVVAAPPPKPTAPPLPFTFLGKKLENGNWEAYLAKGGETYVVQEKSVIDGVYRADAITPTTLTLTYLPLKQTQRLVIGGE